MPLGNKFLLLTLGAFATSRGAGTVGNLALAALALEHGCSACSNDRVLGRFRTVQWINPLAESKLSLQPNEIIFGNVEAHAGFGLHIRHARQAGHPIRAAHAAVQEGLRAAGLHAVDFGFKDGIAVA